MKIQFENTQDDLQKARQLKDMLKDYEKSISEQDNHILIDYLTQQIDQYLSNPAAQPSYVPTPFDFISSFWNFLSGPSHRELELSKQRRELVERSEHAENMAFEALAESSELRHKFDEALEKIRKLEQELGKKRDQV